MSAAVFGEREQPGYRSSFLLALAVHAILLSVMFLGVRWQTHPPQSVEVELWEPPPPAPVEPPKPAPPKVEPELPKPEPKVEKPDIVEKPAPKPKPKPEPKKPEPKKPEPKAKPKPAPPKDDLELKKRVQDELAREQTAFRDRQMKEQAAREQAGARSRAIAGWTDKIRAKIKGNILLPPDLTGNPEAIFDVAQLPTGEVLSVRLRKSSGHRGYDDAVERAILKSSPLPKPDQPNLFERQLELRFRPQDK
jgi:colicin import membrane protein